jgi:Thioredoxin
MRALLIANADHLILEDILGYAKLIPQLMPDTFNACMNTKKYADSVQEAAKRANGEGVSGTPTLLIAKTNGNVVDGPVLGPNNTAPENRLRHTS